MFHPKKLEDNPYYFFSSKRGGLIMQRSGQKRLKKPLKSKLKYIEKHKIFSGEYVDHI
jgi:hypothetical protein